MLGPLRPPTARPRPHLANFMLPNCAQLEHGEWLLQEVGGSPADALQHRLLAGGLAHQHHRGVHCRGDPEKGGGAGRAQKRILAYLARGEEQERVGQVPEHWQEVLRSCIVSRPRRPLTTTS